MQPGFYKSNNMKTKNPSKSKKNESIEKVSDYQSLNGDILSKLKGGNQRVNMPSADTDRLCGTGCGSMNYSPTGK